MTDYSGDGAPLEPDTVGDQPPILAPHGVGRASNAKWFFIGGALLIFVAVILTTLFIRSSGPKVANSYIGRGNPTSIFIQWQQNGSQMTGTIQVDSVSGSAPNESLATNSYDITGLISGNHINITVNGNSIEGVITGSAIVITSANSDGTLSVGTLNPGFLADFNKLATSLNAGISSANQIAAQQQATQSDQSAIVQAADNVTSDMTQLSQDQAALSSSVQALPALVKQAQIDTATTTSSAKTAEKLGPSDNCSTADTTSSDADTVQSDVDSVQSGVDSVTGAISAVSSDIQTLQDDASKLQSAQASLPAFQNNSPSSASIQQAITFGNQATSSAVSKTNSSIDLANATLVTAAQAANAADLAGSCGGYPPTASIPHIS